MEVIPHYWLTWIIGDASSRVLQMPSLGFTEPNEGIVGIRKACVASNWSSPIKVDHLNPKFSVCRMLFSGDLRYNSPVASTKVIESTMWLTSYWWRKAVVAHAYTTSSCRIPLSFLGSWCSDMFRAPHAANLNVNPAEDNKKCLICSLDKGWSKSQSSGKKITLAVIASRQIHLCIPRLGKHARVYDVVPPWERGPFDEVGLLPSAASFIFQLQEV